MSESRHIIQTDFSLPWVSDIFNGFRSAVERVLTRETEAEWFDGLFVAEHLEEILGLTAALSQVYVNRTWADVTKSGMQRPEGLKFRLILAQGKEIEAHPDVSAVQLLYHLSNYWKHSAEWPDWQPVGKRKRTVLALRAVGITEDTQFPCTEAMRKINTRLEGLFDTILHILGSWRESVVEHHLATGLSGAKEQDAKPSPSADAE